MLEKLSISRCKGTSLARIEQLKMSSQLAMHSPLLKEVNHQFQDDPTTLVCIKLDIKAADRQVEADKLQSEMEWWYLWLLSLQRAQLVFLQERKN